MIGGQITHVSKSFFAKATQAASKSGSYSACRIYQVRDSDRRRPITTGRPQARGFRVLAIGNTIIDTVLTMPVMPVDDKVWVDSKKKFVGGQGMNCAQDMALLGLDVSIFTRVGDDDEGETARKHFKKIGLDLQHCISVPNALTMSACVTIATETNERSCLMHKDALMFEYNVAARIQAVVEMVEAGKYDAVYTDGYQLDLVLPVALAASRRGIPVLADIEEVDDDTRKLAALATELITPVKTICTLSGLADPGKAALALADRAGRTVVGTAGAEGSYAARHGDTEPCFVPAFSGCRPRDTVGAGDAYHAGFMAATHRDLGSLRDHMEFATRVAAALCETHGPVVSRENLQRYGLLPEAAR